MNLIDVHAHLDIVDEETRKAMIDRAVEKGVKVVINNSVGVESNRKSLELQEEHEIVKAALGLYPIDALKMSEEAFEKELEFIRDNKSKVAALGEIGLDYQETEDRDRQQKLLELQLKLANELDKPVIVHSRKAEKEVVETLINSGCKKVILHAFHGTMKLVKASIDAGFCFSIPSNVVRSNHFQKMVEIIPLENLFTETDTPYLGPFYEKQSEPAYVEMSIKKIAEIKGLEEEKVAEQLYDNFKQTFDIK